MQEMESVYKQNDSVPICAEIQTSIETAREAHEVIIVELVALAASGCRPDELHSLAEKVAHLKLTVVEKMREHRQLRLEVNKLKLAKAARKLEKQSLAKGLAPLSAPC